MANNRYCVDLAKRGTAGCKNCNVKIDKGVLRIGKIIPNPFSDGGADMKQWFHVRCMFDKLSRARATTKKIEDTDDLEGWDDLDDDSKQEVLKCLKEFSTSFGKQTPTKTPKKKKDASPARGKSPTKGGRASDGEYESPSKDGGSSDSGAKGGSSSKDNLFKEFRRLCAAIADEPSYNEKTAIVADFFARGSDKKGFKGDLYLWVKMLLPAVNKRVYNLQSKQLIKLFSQIFGASQEEMLEDLEQGDVAETVRIFFEDSDLLQPAKKSTLSLQEVDKYLDELAVVSREEEQLRVLKKIAKRCTGNDLKMIVRLIKHDLRIGTGPKHILEALNPTAYQAFQASRDLKDVVKRSLKQMGSKTMKKELSIKANILTPVLPMLAQPCRSVDDAFKKCPNGLLVEIKYDGERVQVHKKGNEFSYFSRSLKPVMSHKVFHLKDYIPRAFPYGDDLILDSEILLVDKDGKPLPFGTLGAHKKTAFKDANVCLFVFDCLQYNDENLMDRPLSERRKILHENMKEIKNHIMFSEMRPVKDQPSLKRMIHSVIQQGLEGLIIKDKKSVYEPGKRHWLKVKKDYLDKGAMSDSADLVVLGAFYGTGNKGGMKSIFLMGCYDDMTKKWCTVTKVHTGHDDATLNRLQKELDMIKISRDPNKVPNWLNVSKQLTPDFVAADPKESPVWEITGAEFSKSDAHTAGGISIRFPRVTHIRDDKTWRTATSLKELKKLYEISKETTDMIGLAEPDDDSDGRSSSSSRSGRSKHKHVSKKRKRGTSWSESPAEKIKADDASPVHLATTDKRKDSPVHLSGLPDIFSGVKLYLPPPIPDVDVLRRYFIAYDGVLLEAHEKSEANFAVVFNGDSNEGHPGAEQVTVDWLWDCIKLQKRIPVHMYRHTK